MKPISRNVFIALVLVGVGLRLALIATSIGTNDVVAWMAFGRLIDRVGIAASYSYIADLNHPPLSLAILLAIERLRVITGIETGDLLRLVQTGFDLLAVGALLVIGRNTGVPPRPLALFYFLSPVSIFVSGFHGNTDPAMVALLLSGLALLIRERPQPIWAGVLFAASTGIKIVPLLLLPLVFLWRRDRWRFTAGFAAAAAAIFGPAIVIGGEIVVERIFGYKPAPGNSGFAFFVLSIADHLESGTQPVEWLTRLGFAWIHIARYVTLAAVAAYSLALVAWRRRNPAVLLAGCGTIILLLLALRPGGGVQYLLWPIAFLPFALPQSVRWLVLGVFSFAQFTAYTVWSGGFPWWYADATVLRPELNLIWFGNLIWLTTLAASVIAVARTLRKPTSA